MFFGAADGQATLDQAEQFALLWADDVADSIVGVRFGNIDGAKHWQARWLFAVEELPATLVIRNGVITQRFDGPHLRIEIAQALRTPSVKEMAARLPLWMRPLTCQAPADAQPAEWKDVWISKAA